MMMPKTVSRPQKSSKKAAETASKKLFLFAPLRSRKTEALFATSAVQDGSKQGPYEKRDGVVFFNGADVRTMKDTDHPILNDLLKINERRIKTLDVNVLPTINEAKVEEYRQLIAANWQKSVSAILEVAKLCYDAKETLNSAELARLKESLPFDAATFSKLTKIGEATLFQDAEVQPLLPSKFSLLYELAKIDEVVVREAVGAQKIFPAMTRDDLAALKGEVQTSQTNPPEPRLNPPFYAGVLLKPKYSRAALSKLNIWLLAGEKLLAVYQIPNQSDLRAKTREERIMVKLRASSKKVVNEAIRKNFNSPNLNREIVTIGNDSTRDDIRRILEMVWQEDKYPALVARAEEDAPPLFEEEAFPKVVKPKSRRSKKRLH
jgi:hypothetical protein